MKYQKYYFANKKITKTLNTLNYKNLFYFNIIFWRKYNIIYYDSLLFITIMINKYRNLKF